MENMFIVKNNPRVAEEMRVFLKDFLTQAIPFLSYRSDHVFPIYEMYGDGIGHRFDFCITDLKPLEHWMDSTALNKESKLFYLPIQYQKVSKRSDIFCADCTKCLWTEITFGENGDYASAEDAYIALRNSVDGRVVKYPSYYIKSENSIVAYWILRNPMCCDFFIDSKQTQISQSSMKIEFKGSLFTNVMLKLHRDLIDLGLKISNSEEICSLRKLLPLPIGRVLPVKVTGDANTSDVN